MTKRRIFVGGLTNDNFKVPPEDSGLAFLKFGNGDKAAIADNLIKSGDDEAGNIQEVHIYKPHNIVIADYDWLKKNWYKVDFWKQEGQEGGTHITDIYYDFKKGDEDNDK